jgi:hypothetical protein
VREVGLKDVAEQATKDDGCRLGVVGRRKAGHVVADEHELAHAAEKGVDERRKLVLGIT